jgi:hypothetical protein
VNAPEDIVSLMNTPRLTSLLSEGGVVTAEGQATKAKKGDDLRTYWFTSVGALAYVQRFGGSRIVRRVLDGATALDAGDAGGGEPVGTLVDPKTFLSEDDLNDHARSRADDAGVVVEEVNYVPFLGGTAEFVLRPTDESEFWSEFDERMSRLFRGFPEEGRPSLVTIVNGRDAIRLVQGHFPLSDGDRPQYTRLPDGTKAQIAGGEGFAWYAPDVQAILRPEGPVQNAPGG